MSDALAEALNMILAVLPEHRGELSITHNPHRSMYHTVADYATFLELDNDDWVTDAERMRAIETGEMWELRWYPNTPVGFCLLAASSLDALLRGVRLQAEREDG